MAKTPNTVRPGQRVPDSGIYRNTRTGERVTLVRDKIVPPTSHPNERYREVVNTNPNNDRKK
jgi:hypothetical protein